MAEFYKKEGYNPMSGCLPLLIQFPIFIAMYNLFNNHFDLRGAMFIPGWIPDLSHARGDLELRAHQRSSIWQVERPPRSCRSSISSSQLLYGKFTQQPTPAGQSATQMKIMMYGMPIIFFFILYDVPSGLLVYWIVSNLLTIVQQIVINDMLKKRRKHCAAAAAARRRSDRAATGSRRTGRQPGTITQTFRLFRSKHMVYEFEGQVREGSHRRSRPRSWVSSATASTSRSSNPRPAASSRRARCGSASIRGDEATPAAPPEAGRARSQAWPPDEFEAKILEFTKRMIEGMGYSCEVAVLFREEKKLGIRIDSEHASIIIGKKGKNLDALQLLVNVYAGRLGREDTRVILDSENYRIRREEALVRLAYETAEAGQAQRRQSVLLEPMNPFERRIIHTTLNDIVDIETKSEGEGLYKQVRVFFRGRP